MESINRQIRSAQRRLFYRTLGEKLIHTLVIATLLAGAVIVSLRFFDAAPSSAWAWLAVAGGLALAAALGWTWRRRADRITAATEIDRRFALHERVASAATLDDRQRLTAMGRAVVADAANHVAPLAVEGAFAVYPPARTWLPLLYSAAIVTVALMVVHPTRPSHEQRASGEENAQVRNSAAELARRLEQKRQHAHESGFDASEDLLKELEHATRLLSDTPTADRKQALISLNDLTAQADARRDKLAGLKAVRAQLERLHGWQQGPLEKFGSALKQGDTQAAGEALARLGERLTAGELDAAEREALANQLAQAQRALDKIVESHERAQRELDERLARAIQAGDHAEAERLRQRLAELAQRDAEAARLAEMSDNLKNATEHARAGDPRAAAEDLSRMREDLARAERELAELETLDAALADVAQCKNALACRECQGQGCVACQAPDAAEHAAHARLGPPGHGAGRPLEDDRKADAGHYESRVPQTVGRGPLVTTGTADGPNRKGQALEAIKAEFAGTPGRGAEALSNQRLPRGYRDHAREYFESLREGPSDTPRPAE